jgi:hypothetical protein
MHGNDNTAPAAAVDLAQNLDIGSCLEESRVSRPARFVEAPGPITPSNGLGVSASE